MDQTNIRRGSHAVQNRNYYSSSSSLTYDLNYQIKLHIPRSLFISDYPKTIKNLGDLIRKTRMDLGLNSKQLAKQLGVDECTITNWEFGKTQPIRNHLKSVVNFLRMHLNESVPEKEFWELCFQNDKFYPRPQNTLGEKLKATRMQKFLTVKQLAKILNVDPSSLNKWELMKAKPIPEYKEKIISWIGRNKANHI